MRANAKNTGMWRTALCALGASALIAGCATDPADDGLDEGTYAVQGLDLGSCANDTWVASSTTMSSLVVSATVDGYAVKACTQDNCAPLSPTNYQWSVDAWRGSDGGAYLVETGCLLVSVDATARRDGDQLVIEASRWSSNLIGGTCTYAEVIAMRETACTDRIRLTASVE